MCACAHYHSQPRQRARSLAKVVLRCGIASHGAAHTIALTHSRIAAAAAAAHAPPLIVP
jgi:hypothetical protein